MIAPAVKQRRQREFAASVANSAPSVASAAAAAEHRMVGPPRPPATARDERRHRREAAEVREYVLEHYARKRAAGPERRSVGVQCGTLPSDSEAAGLFACLAAPIAARFDHTPEMAVWRIEAEDFFHDVAGHDPQEAIRALQSAQADVSEAAVALRARRDRLLVDFLFGAQAFVEAASIGDAVVDLAAPSRPTVAPLAEPPNPTLVAAPTALTAPASPTVPAEGLPAAVVSRDDRRDDFRALLAARQQAEAARHAARVQVQTTAHAERDLRETRARLAALRNTLADARRRAAGLGDDNRALRLAAMQRDGAVCDLEVALVAARAQVAGRETEAATAKARAALQDEALVAHLASITAERAAMVQAHADALDAERAQRDLIVEQRTASLRAATRRLQEELVLVRAASEEKDARLVALTAAHARLAAKHVAALRHAADRAAAYAERHDTRTQPGDALHSSPGRTPSPGAATSPPTSPRHL